MRAVIYTSAALMVGGALYFAARNPGAPGVVQVAGGLITEGVQQVSKAVQGWNIGLVPQIYRDPIRNAEIANGIPAGMLARLLWQESRYRPDIISGATRSPVGALGIAQFMPATARDMGIDPLDPMQAIPAAARYLAQCFKWTGGNDWAKALAAYNWGAGNVNKKGLANAPKETRNYYAGILGDLGMMA